MKQRRSFFSATFGEKAFDTINSILIIILSLLVLYPFWYCIILSFNDGVDALKGPLYLIPRKFTLDNYAFVLSSSQIVTAAVNSVLRTVLGVLLQLLVTGVAAYGLSKKQILCHKVYMLFFLFTMYFSGGLIPTYLLYRNIGLVDNFLVYILPGAWSFYNAILIMAYYESIPEALEEAATIDGAGKIAIFFRIILPASMPIFATIAIFTGVAQWNSWFDTVIYTTSPKLVTLQSFMMRMLNEAEALKELAKNATGGTVLPTVKPATVRVATLVITTFPITVIYPFLQKYFVKGLMIGSVKG